MMSSNPEADGYHQGEAEVGELPQGDLTQDVLRPGCGNEEPGHLHGLLPGGPWAGET
jgi:hypothetical protein